MPRKHETLVAAMKTSLARAVERRRVERKLSQGRLAARIGSSQSRVSKLEAGDPTVSLDLLVRALLATGATRRDVARAVG